MVAKVQVPVLKKTRALIVSLEDCYFKRVETLSIHCLAHPNLPEKLYDFQVAVGSSIVKECVVAIIPLVVSLQALEDHKEYLILIVPNRNHQRRPSVIVRMLRIKPFIQQNPHQLLLPVSCSQMKYRHSLARL